MIQGQDQHRFGYPQQKQQQMHPYNPILFSCRINVSSKLDEPGYFKAMCWIKIIRILANRHALAPEDPRLHGMGSALDADLLLKQNALLSQYDEKANYIQQHGSVVPSGGVCVESCLPNDIVGSNPDFQSVGSSNFQKASNNVWQKRKECSPALHPVVKHYLDHSRAGPASHCPATVQSAVEQPLALYQSSCYDSTDYDRAESALCLPTTVPNQTNDGLTSSVSHSESLAFPTPVTQPVAEGTTLNDNGVLQVESMLS